MDFDHPLYISPNVQPDNIVAEIVNPMLFYSEDIG